MRNIGGIGESMLPKVIGCADQREPLGVSETAKTNAGTFTHDASAAIRANRPFSLECLDSARGFCRHDHPVCGLMHRSRPHLTVQFSTRATAMHQTADGVVVTAATPRGNETFEGVSAIGAD